VFEKCPALAWTLHEDIIKCFLVKEAAPKEEGKEEAKKEAKNKEGGRSNHQRLLAIDLYSLLIKVAMKDSEAK